MTASSLQYTQSSGLEYHLGLLKDHSELLVIILGKVLMEQAGESTTGHRMDCCLVHCRSTGLEEKH